MTLMDYVRVYILRRWHVIKIGKYYYVRKFGFIFNRYLDRDEGFGWSVCNGYNYYRTKEDAILRLGETRSEIFAVQKD